MDELIKDSLWILKLACHPFASLGIEIDVLSDKVHFPISI